MNQEIIDNNYLVVRNFIPASDAKDMAEEFRVFAVANNLQGDSQAPQSWSCYNYQRLLVLMARKTNHVSSVLGEEVLPTYCYTRIYKYGDELVPHVDRPACEISLTINLNKDSDWPIYIKKPNGDVASVELEPGDAMVYLGCIAPHWRDVFTKHEHCQTFFHYVRADGPNSWAVFDHYKQQLPTLPTDSIPVTRF